MLYSFLTALFVQGVVRVVLAAVGIGIVSFVGFDLLISNVFTLVRSNFDGLPDSALGMLGVARIDLALNIIVSSYTVKLSLVALKKLRIL